MGSGVLYKEPNNDAALYSTLPAWRFADLRRPTAVKTAVKTAVPPWLQFRSNTESFEVSVNGQLIYSKLKTGSIPSKDEVVELIKKFFAGG
ncbi:hypothetical protein PBY51_018732 [Eleginops maclovinus]|uniref:Uncharacterized protein n=1 Tax=Eleginops maclovinus TaxID=56733 RepID=A0AAN8AV51_ELEMC|nr:hypothetical protein PBY51_018732 [Eleginops maclovinus]